MFYKNIILIDDDPEDIEIFLEAVTSISSGINCRTYDKPVTALGELTNIPELPDLIFLDYNMPILNGSEFLGKIKNDLKLKDIPVIMLSSPSKEFMNDFIKKMIFSNIYPSQVVIASLFPSLKISC
ncbi:Response regulator rcp1 [compost metagenome]